MNTIQNQYAYFFSKLGYTTEFFPEKGLFYLKEIETYCKLCDDPAPPDIVNRAIEQAKKHTIVLLEGALTYRAYMVYQGEYAAEGIFVTNGDKYSPFYYSGGDFYLDNFEKELINMTLAIRCGEDVICQRCGSINDFTISKPSLHYKATCKCGTYITNLSENKPSLLHFGKYKGRAIKSMSTKEEIDYLNWGLSQGIFKGKLKKDIQERISEL
jgi:hypothetical protein